MALWFPYLDCEAAKPPSAPPDTPFALVARAGNALRLAAVNAIAAGLGLAPGMALADARARHPQLATLPHDPAWTARALASLATRARRFTPVVAIHPPDAITLEITGVAHLFGGEAALVAQVCAALTFPGPFTARHALAGNAAAARALARYGGDDANGDVRQLPITALGLPRDALTTLSRAGLATLGDLAARPLGPLAARLGEAAVQTLREIMGEAARPMAAVPIPRRFTASRRFAEPIGREADVLAAIGELLATLALQLARAGRGARAATVTLARCDGAVRELTVAVVRPTREAAPLLRLFAERIETLADPLNPGFGYDGIALAVPAHEPLGAGQIGLDDALPSASRAGGSLAVGELLDRLAVRLGSDAVRRLAARDSHIPERAQRWLATNDGAGGGMAGAQTGWPKDAPRPLLLLDPPEPVSAIASVPDGPPRRWVWRGATHVLAQAEGPERIGPEWWRQVGGHEGSHKSGQAALTRDYYRLEDSEGARFWVFRQGLYGGLYEGLDEGHIEPRWYLHGLFA